MKILRRGIIGTFFNRLTLVGVCIKLLQVTGKERWNLRTNTNTTTMLLQNKIMLLIGHIF